MIVVISNRNITGKLDGKSKPFSILGMNLSENGNVYAKVVDGNKLDLFTEKDKHKLFEPIVEKIKKGNTKLKRPWVVFLHGNNQTTAKNIEKAIDIENEHDVNVITFSWPSQPYTGKDDQILRTIKKEATRKLIQAIGGTNIVSLVLSKGADKAEEFIRNYVLARMNAEASPPDFSQALKVINQSLVKELGNKMKISFLCHSLGNYLLQNTLNSSTFPIKFVNIMLHQADVDSLNHSDWVKKLYTKKQRLYITTNEYDYVLMASNYVNRKERLGQTKHSFNCKQCHYIDFSDAAYTSHENEHEFFRLSNSGNFNYTNDYIHKLIGETCRSQNPKLTPKSGFKNYTDNRYHLIEYIDPIDGVLSHR